MYSRANGEVAIVALTSLPEELVAAGLAKGDVPKDAGSGGGIDDTCNTQTFLCSKAMVQPGPVVRSDLN